MELLSFKVYDFEEGSHRSPLPEKGSNSDTMPWFCLHFSLGGRSVCPMIKEIINQGIRMATQASHVTKDKLIADIKVVIHDCEQILKETAGQAGEKVAELRSQISRRLVDAKARLSELEDAAIEKTKEVARAADEYVHENPWKAVGIAAGIGLLIGLMIRRR